MFVFVSNSAKNTSGKGKWVTKAYGSPILSTPPPPPYHVSEWGSLRYFLFQLDPHPSPQSSKKTKNVSDFNFGMKMSDFHVSVNNPQIRMILLLKIALHYKTFACRMTIFHYFLSKQTEKGFLGYLNVFIYSNEHFYLSQSEKNCQKVKNLLILGHFSKIKKNWENGKNEKKIKFLFYSFFSQIMLVKYIYFQSSYSFWHKTAQK